MRVAGVDVAKDHDHTVVVILDGFNMVGCHQIPHGLTWVEIANQVDALLQGCDLVCLDNTGVGNAFSALLAFPSITNITFTAPMKHRLMTQLVEVIQGKHLQLDPEAPSVDLLVQELQNLEVTPTAKGWKVSGKRKGHDDCAMALALAVHALYLLVTS